MSSAEATVRVPVEESLKKAAEEIDAAAGFYHGSSLQLDSMVGSPGAVVIKPLKFKESLWEASIDFEADFDFYKMETKIHRFPPGLGGLGGRYIVPTMVAIGPYHHSLSQLMEMEKVKNVAAHYFIQDANTTYENIYAEFRPVATEARSSYARDAVAGIQEAEFVGMMFRDACFLLQYMLCMSSSLGGRGGEKFDVNPSLRRFIFSNRACIENDVMLLENQLPWKVLDALRKFSSVKIEDFVAQMGNRFQIREALKAEQSFVRDPDIYTPPHLLGLLRFYKLGRKAPNPPVPDDGKAPDDGVGKDGDEPKKRKTEAGLKQISVSSAIELAEIGVRLKPSKTADFMDMGMEKAFLGKLSLAPLSLDSTKACWLVNMAAFEVCTVSRFQDHLQKTAVCSYIALLAMLMDREEDVHRLRSKKLLHGNYTNKEMLDFFNSLAKHLPDGGYKFARIMADIESYKRGCFRRILIKVYKFLYRNWKTIAAVLSLLGAIAGIMKAVLSI